MEASYHEVRPGMLAAVAGWSVICGSWVADHGEASQHKQQLIRKPRLWPAGRLTFAQIMKMFRNDLLDLNDILNYIRLAPQDSPATSPAVSTPPQSIGAASRSYPAQALALCLPFRLRLRSYP